MLLEIACFLSSKMSSHRDRRNCCCIQSHFTKNDKNAILMIGDSKNDIFAATAANMESIGLTYGYNHGEDIKSQGASVVLDDFAEIINTLDKTSNASR